MKREIQVFRSLAEAEVADHEYYAALTPQQRLDLALELAKRYREAHGEDSERLARVYRVTELARR